MHNIHAWLALLSLASVKRVALIFFIVLVGVEAMVLAYYWDAGVERLGFEFAISAIITATVGLPVITYLVIQHERLRALSEKFAYLSSTDQMTGLLNQQTFVERLEALLAETGKDRSGGVFAYVDADHFKRLNDRFGHALGDRVIQILGKYILAETRSGDLCGRLGGEEFGIFLAGATLDEAGPVAERLRRQVNSAERDLNLPGLSIPISVSIGIVAHRPGDSAAATMQAADRSLYAAKNEGRNAVVIEMKRYRAA